MSRPGDLPGRNEPRGFTARETLYFSVVEHHNNPNVDIKAAVRRGNFKLLYRLLLIGGFGCVFASFAFIDMALVLAAFPMLAIALMAWSKGYVGVATPEGWNRPDILWLVIPGGGFSWLVAMYTTPNLIDCRPLVPWCIGLALIMLVPFIIVIRRYAHKPNRWVWLSFICFAAGTIPAATGLLMSLNYRLDPGPKSVTRGVVTDRDKSSGRRADSYTIDIAALDLKKPYSRISAPKYWYEAVDIGDTVRLLSGDGRFGAVWFELYGEAGKWSETRSPAD